MKNMFKDCPLCGCQDLKVRFNDKGCKFVECRRCHISIHDERGHADARWNGLQDYLLGTALLIMKTKIASTAEHLLKDIAEIESDLRTRRLADIDVEEEV